MSGEPCAVCQAIAHPGFTVEAAHLAGMAIGISFAGGRTPREAWGIAKRDLCARHYQALRFTIQTFIDVVTLPPEPPS